MASVSLSGQQMAFGVLKFYEIGIKFNRWRNAGGGGRGRGGGSVSDVDTGLTCIGEAPTGESDLSAPLPFKVETRRRSPRLTRLIQLKPPFMFRFGFCHYIFFLRFKRCSVCGGGKGDNLLFVEYFFKK